MKIQDVVVENQVSLKQQDLLEMYVIKSGDKFLNATLDTNPNRLANLQVSAKPKTYKTKQEAMRVLGLIDTYFNETIAEFESLAAKMNSAIESDLRKLAKLQATYEHMINLPYKLVHEKVGKLERQIENLRERISVDKSDKGYAPQMAARLKKIAATDRVVAKIN